MIELDHRALRKDLSDRECAVLLGAALSGLVAMSSPLMVERALTWWAERPSLLHDRSRFPTDLRE